jgi:phosphatidylserine decarboxylase
LIASIVLAGILAGVLKMARVSSRKALVFSGIVCVAMSVYMLYFFRDPVRVAPRDTALIVAGAEGRVMGVVEVFEPEFLKIKTVRISIFLSLIDVHVNRSPIAGRVDVAEYFPGARYFTFLEKSSEFNQHSSIVVRGEKVDCLIKQIVGPVARRVVFWDYIKSGYSVSKGESIGMMKFGSRLDMYLPADKVDVVVAKGDKVRVGETVVARLKSKE